MDETLIKVDEVIGNFDNIEIVGLGNNQNAYVTVDYEADTVTLSLGATGQGSGKVTLGTAGNEADAQDNADLWAALTNGHGIYPDDPPEDIPGMRMTAARISDFGTVSHAKEKQVSYCYLYHLKPSKRKPAAPEKGCGEFLLERRPFNLQHIRQP